MSTGRLQRLLDDIRARRTLDAARLVIPEEPAWNIPQFSPPKLEWKPTELEPLPPPRPLSEVRQSIVNKIIEYAQNEADYAGDMLLMRVPPGTGKTTASVDAVQQLADAGQRILYVSSRKNFFAELMAVPGVKREMWYNWRSMDDTVDGIKDGEPMCRYAEEIHAWMLKGYPAIEFCKQMCIYDQWIGECPYRQQSKRKEPIIFGRHQHLVSGMAIKRFDLAICDEMPLNAFIERRRIPKDSIMIADAGGSLGVLMQRLYNLSCTLAKQISGKVLMSYTADVVGRVFDEIEVLGDFPQTIPDLYRPEQAFDVSYFYVFELLKKLSPEYECYRNDWKDWISRVTVGPLGIVMFGRKEAQKKWIGTDNEFHVPGKMVVLDATGHPETYRRLMHREVIEYAPQVERPGRVYQIVSRLNGSSTIYEAEDGPTRLLKCGRDMLAMCKMIAEHYTGRVGVVTFKNAEPFFAEVFGASNTLHFGALRGSNLLETCECLIVAGGYAPNMFGLMTLTASLHPDRMVPFTRRADDGTPINPWTHRLCEYRMRTPGELAPWRLVGGFWEDDDLGVYLDEFRRNEIAQAIHRSRIVSRETDVWVLTNVPTNEPLDAIYEDISELDFLPPYEVQETEAGNERRYGIAWRQWIKLKSWLDEQWHVAEYVTADQMAEACEVTPGTVQNQRWISALDAFFKKVASARPWGEDLVRVCPTDRMRQRVLVPVESEMK